MLKFNYSDKISALIRAGIAGIIFLIPIFFAVIIKTTNVFELSKAAIFKIAVLLLLFLYIAKVLLYNDYEFLKIYKNKRLAIIIFLFLFFLALSALISIDCKTSISGSYDRLQGLIIYIYFILFFLLALFSVKSDKQANFIIWAAALSLLLVCAYTIIQACGLDPLKWSESTRLRATSTLGQPNNLGSYLILVLPLCAYLAASSGRWIIKILAIAIGIIGLSALFFTYSISSWVGLMLGGLITAIVFIINLALKPSGRVKIKKLALIAAAGIAIFSLLAFLLYQNSNTKGKLINKISSAFNITSGSTAARAQFWQAAIQGIKEKPWLGHGLDTQREILVKYYQPDWAVYSNVNVGPSRAHNLFLDTLLTQGIFGLAALIAMLYLFYYALWVNIRKNQARLLNFCFFVSFSSYLIYLQFNYHHITALVYFWLYFAIAAGIYIRGGFVGEDKIIASVSQNINTSRKKNIRLPLTVKIFILAFVFGLAVFQINREFRKITADHYWREINAAFAKNEYYPAINLYGLIKSEMPKYGYYDRQFAFMMAEWLTNFTNPEFRQAGEEKLTEILPNISGRTFFSIFAKAKTEAALAQGGRHEYYRAAENDFQRLIELSPNYPAIYFEYARILWYQEKYPEAAENFKLALSKLPALDASGMNKDHQARVRYEMEKNLNGLVFVYERLGDAEMLIKYQIELASIKN